MNANVGNYPAFPLQGQQPGSAEAGLTLREYFAATALPAVIHQCAHDTLKDGETRAQMMARKAVECADALLVALTQVKP